MFSKFLKCFINYVTEIQFVDYYGHAHSETTDNSIDEYCGKYLALSELCKNRTNSNSKLTKQYNQITKV